LSGNYYKADDLGGRLELKNILASMPIGENSTRKTDVEIERLKIFLKRNVDG